MAGADPQALKETFLSAIDAAGTPDALETVRIETLGKKGELTMAMKSLGQLDGDARREMGQALNTVKDAVTQALDARRSALAMAELNRRLESETVDVTLSHRPETMGVIHPLSRTLEDILAIFAEMGFVVAEGPDIESDYYNFTALNMPEDHPARQEHDTFYMTPDADGLRKVLRTHTSPVQIRTMEKMKPPIRIIAPGRTYRSDHDATHSPMFHQCEGLVIGDGITMAHLKGCLIEFCRAFSGNSKIQTKSDVS
ncbi:MAG: phenylalanine--tRNA ligase subunit alpha [Candidatus Puniceispirillales bacterium]